jgi:glycosyltransferase involved in cell wall biosynthesis
MRFCVDAHAIGRRLTGNEVYIRSLLESFASVDRESDFVAYISTDEAARIVPARFGTRRVSPNPFLRLGREMSQRLKEDSPDLVHVQYTAPLNCPAPIVVSVHDVSFLEHPEYFTPSRALQLKLTVRNTVRRAARILTGSEFSRAAIARAYALDPGQITVVPNAAASLFRPTQREAAIGWVHSRLGFAAPFILTVGDLQARKNQAGLIRAFAEMLRARPECPHHLVLAGQDSWHGAEVHAAAQRSGFAGRIHFTGFVSDPDLLELYNACEFFVFPSFYEGFGLPVLEAMACGRAVACSNSSAVHEVADAAARLFDPHSIREMMQSMIALATDPALRARMERSGIERAARFSWRRTAEQTLAVYYGVARGARAAAGVANS